MQAMLIAMLPEDQLKKMMEGGMIGGTAVQQSLLAGRGINMTAQQKATSRSRGGGTMFDIDVEPNSPDQITIKSRKDPEQKHRLRSR
jgi:hypothetical protein